METTDSKAHCRSVIGKAAVLGAGVMGAQIAAHLTNAGVQTILFDLPGKEKNKNAISEAAIKRLLKLKPAPLAYNELAAQIIPANYEEHLAWLKDCDFVVEAIAEKLDWKEELYQKIIPHLKSDVILASNTSGLSINHLAQLMPEKLRARFCGVHFFNPPRYMHLVEVIPNDMTDENLLRSLETFLVSGLGKGVIFAKDTPNFIANRIGTFSMLAIFHHTERLGLGFDVVDALTGPAIGRAKSATYRTIDVVGLDTLDHVIGTMTTHLAQDPWAEYFHSPSWLKKLIEQGALGQKAGIGFYQKQGKEIKVLDLASGEYRPNDPQIAEEVTQILAISNVAERFAKLRASQHPQAQFLWSIFRDLFHYSAVHAATIADNVRDIDLALRWGFGWQQGPFELWQQAGWSEVAEWIKQDIAKGNALVSTPLPGWVLRSDNDHVYSEQGAFSPVTQQYEPRSGLAVYQRQLFPDPVLGETRQYGATLLETESVRLWDGGDDIAVLSFKSKKNTFNGGVLEGIQQAVAVAEQNSRALVIWQSQGDHFSFGADLRQFREQTLTAKPGELANAVDLFQQTSLALRYAMIPTVAAVKGMALGGGCEIPLHCSRIVAAFETYIGLVEVGVGLLPAGGGSKEMALRAAQLTSGKDHFDRLAAYFQLIAMGQVSNNAVDAQQKGLLRPSDVVVFNPYELLYVAKQQAIALAESGYRPPLPYRFPVVGKPGVATLQAFLVNMREGGYISEYDYYLGCKIAEVMCGGLVEAHSMVDEAWVLRLEREAFVELAQQEKTQERIKYMLEKGKPLRN